MATYDYYRMYISLESGPASDGTITGTMYMQTNGWFPVGALQIYLYYDMTVMTCDVTTQLYTPTVTPFNYIDNNGVTQRGATIIFGDTLNVTDQTLGLITIGTIQFKLIPGTPIQNVNITGIVVSMTNNHGISLCDKALTYKPCNTTNDPNGPLFSGPTSDIYFTYHANVPETNKTGTIMFNLHDYRLYITLPNSTQYGSITAQLWIYIPNQGTCGQLSLQLNYPRNVLSVYGWKSDLYNINTNFGDGSVRLNYTNAEQNIQKYQHFVQIGTVTFNINKESPLQQISMTGILNSIKGFDGTTFCNEETDPCNNRNTTNGNMFSGETSDIFFSNSPYTPSNNKTGNAIVSGSQPEETTAYQPFTNTSMPFQTITTPYPTTSILFQPMTSSPFQPMTSSPFQSITKSNNKNIIVNPLKAIQLQALKQDVQKAFIHNSVKENNFTSDAYKYIYSNPPLRTYQGVINTINQQLKKTTNPAIRRHYIHDKTLIRNNNIIQQKIDNFLERLDNIT